MKQVSHWLNPLAILTAAAIAWANPSTSREASASPAADLTKRVDSIEIYVPPPERGNNGICSFFIEPAIDAIIDRPSLKRGKWGILVQSLDDGRTLYSHHPDQYLIPASNVKILTTAAALQRLDSGASIRSKSLRQWVTVTNLRSNNYYADTLLRHIGGSQVAKRALTQLGVNPNHYRMADGSGLSRRNAATPRVLVETLRAMNSARGREVFLASLPVAGESGTLRNRFRQTRVQGMVQAKTGTLRGVRALSGYMNHPQYGTLVFSILVNQPGQSGSALVGAIDEIVLRVSMLTPCN
ncbi:MAG: D-alanyl-D-alanine carboxypeptidase/D-alanyl-D-alanine-endopeptidase [Xenococcaceae cyanobacterium]